MMNSPAVPLKMRAIHVGLMKQTMTTPRKRARPAHAACRLTTDALQLLHHHGLTKRKKRLPEPRLKLMDLVVPLSVTVSGGVVQLVSARSVFC